MSAKNHIRLAALLLVGIFLTACSTLTQVDEPISGEFGPQITAREHQTKTFETLWARLEQYYIDFGDADVDWEGIHAEYLQRIDAGLSNQEFSALLHDLETELPAGALLYRSRAERIEAETVDANAFGGIGVYIAFREEPAPHIVLLSIIDGSPAELAGLKAHDSILEVDGRPILLEEGLAAAERIRGPAGSSVVLSVQSPGSTERKIEVERGSIARTGKIESRLLTGTNYGYILVPPIGYETMLGDLLAGMRDFTSNRKLEGLILDLRIAGSTADWPLEEMLTMFHDGSVGEFYNRTRSSPVSVEGQDLFSSQSVPLVILVGQNTAGSPEILAGSLQANKRAVLVGENTSGAVETTTSFYLPDGSIIFVQTTSFRPPTGEEIGETGLTPNVVIEAAWDEVLPDRDPVIDAAVELLRGAQ